MEFVSSFGTGPLSAQSRCGYIGRIPALWLRFRSNWFMRRMCWVSAILPCRNRFSRRTTSA